MLAPNSSNTPQTPLRDSLSGSGSSWNILGTGTTSYYGPAMVQPINYNDANRTHLQASVKRKRRSSNKENVPALVERTPTVDPSSLNNGDKVRILLAVMDFLGLTYSEVLAVTATPISNLKLGEGALPQGQFTVPIHLEVTPFSGNQITATMQHFFNGNTVFPPGKIIQMWFKHPFGSHHGTEELYSVSTPYTDLKHVRPALTSFAAQVIKRKLVREAENAVQPQNGLHVSTSGKQKNSRKLAWTDIGSATFENVESIIRNHQPLTWSLVCEIATRKPRVRSGVVLARQKRPVNLIASSIISNLNFSRSSQAKLLPLAYGLLYFGSSAPFDLFRFRSRIGDMPSYTTITKAMGALSEYEEAVTLEHGEDPKTIGALVIDNVQNYHFQWDPAIGRENALRIGVSATYYEINLDGIDISAFDLDSSLPCEHSRSELTVNKLEALIDLKHIEYVCVLQWIDVLVQNIPHLKHLQSELSVRYRTRASRQQLKLAAAKVHPLASCDQNEAVTTELKEALFDFYGQLGQRPGAHKRRLFPISGDGLTFEKIIQLKEYLQFEEDDVNSLRITQPILAGWHTEWTNISRLCESHWGPPLSKDPSRLGHSAEKIGRKQPPNLKKVDFYPLRDLVFLVAEARLLDCWRLLFQKDDIFAYFDELASQKTLPSMEDLEPLALQLYRSYTSITAQAKVMKGRKFMGSTPDHSAIPDGEAWPLSQAHGARFDNPKAKELPVPFVGDQTLARSIAFIREAMIARELSLATAEGDAGRVWEVIKFLVFSFAGSSHNKYMGYVLEMIATLELECTPDRRKGLLQMTLVNLTGRAGHWAAGDFIQEYFNRLLEAVVQRKGIDYGSKFIRKTWSRNLHHIGRLKLSWFDGLGMKSRSAKHTGVKHNAEMRVLLCVYKSTGLHTFCPGRTFDEEIFIDDHQRGMKELSSKKLRRWIHKTTRSRNLRQVYKTREECSYESAAMDCEDEGDSEEEDEGEDEIHLDKRPSLRFSFVDGGRLAALDIDNDVLQSAVDALGGTESDEEDHDDDEAGNTDSGHLDTELQDSDVE